MSFDNKCLFLVYLYISSSIMHYMWPEVTDHFPNSKLNGKIAVRGPYCIRLTKKCHGMLIMLHMHQLFTF